MRTRLRHFASPAAALLLFLAACNSSGDPLSPPSTGGINLTLSGLPSGVAGSVTVTGPAAFSRSMTGTGNVDGLAPGTYTVVASSVSNGGNTYLPSPATQSIDVPASVSRVQATVTYAQQNSQLVVTMAGLPGGTNGSVLVTNAAGYSQTVNGTTTLTGLAPGIYTLSASTVTSGTSSYVPTPASQQVQVTVGQSSSATVTYALTVPGSVNLVIDGLYLTQAVQVYGDTVPLVANRDAYLRVFVRADQANTVAPAVRVRLYQGSIPTPVATYTIPAPTASVPTVMDESVLNSSWNQLVPGNLVKTGLRILADVDPGNGVPESNEADNSFPASGLQKPLDVRTVAALNLELVPVTVKGKTGNVSTANLSQFYVTLKKVMPLDPALVNVTLRPTAFTSAADTLKSGSSVEWGDVLDEMYALQAAEGTGKYFYGVVGTTGIGFVPGKSAVGWDRLPSADLVLAHEVGHNLSLMHAPCGTAANPDPNFPYAGGLIGVWGLDVSTLTPKAPSSADLMGYCNGVNWISDYHYQKVLNYRQANTGTVVATSQDGLLVWGRIDNGQVRLQPAMELSAPARLPSRSGPYVVEGLDARGTILFRYSFDGERVADQDNDMRQFAFVIPFQGQRAEQLARLRVRGGSNVAEWTSPSAVAAQGSGAAAMRGFMPITGRAAHILGGSQARLEWNAASYPMAMVRDASSGAILAFARGGAMNLAVTGRQLDVTFSDGVRSRREIVTAQ
jgi:hypothetical protein